MPAITPQSIIPHLHRRERRFHVAQWMRLIFGTLLSCILPFLVAGTVWLAESTHQLSWTLSFIALFQLAILIVCPLAFVMMLLTRRQSIDDQILDAADTGDSFTEFYAANLFAGLAGAGADGAIFLILFQIPPRMMYTGYRQLRSRRRLGRTDFPLAAGLVHRLHLAGQGVPTAMLFKPTDVRPEIARHLVILVFHDWIGLAKDAQRTWILSEAIARLA